MDNLPDISKLFPSLPSSRSSSVTEEQAQNLLLLCHFLCETRDRLHFSPEQITIPSDRQLNNLSDRESILIPFLYPTINALASMTKQLDTVTTQLATVQSIVATLPTTAALDSKLSPIHTSLRNLSQRVGSTPPAPSAPLRQPIPPVGMVTRPAAPPPAPKTRSSPPPGQIQHQHGL